MATLSTALATGRGEVNARWPHRDHASDGVAGDISHASAGYPKTKHMPNPRGRYHAVDLDDDGVDMRLIIARFQQHPNAHLWIYEREIALRREGWRRRHYSGPNPHDKHAHLEDADTTAAERDTRPWGLAGTAPVVTPVTGGGGGGMTRLPVLRRTRGQWRAATVQAQKSLRALGINLGPKGVDGLFGPSVAAATLTFQQRHHLTSDAVIGAQTWCAIAQALLALRGFDPGRIDGRFGAHTTAAVLAFQGARGLEMDRIIGPHTWAALIG